LIIIDHLIDRLYGQILVSVLNELRGLTKFNNTVLLGTRNPMAHQGSDDVI